MIAAPVRGEHAMCRRDAQFEIQRNQAATSDYLAQWLLTGVAQNLHVGYMIGPAYSTDAPQTPLVERINPVTVRLTVSEAIDLTQMF